MSTEDKYAYRGIKFIFSLISVFLMFPSFINGDSTYYRTLFIFLIGKVVDLFFKDESENVLRFKIWDIANQIVGATACAFSFCLMIPDFASILTLHLSNANIFLMACVLSCMIKEIALLIYLAIRTKRINENICIEIEEI